MGNSIIAQPRAKLRKMAFDHGARWSTLFKRATAVGPSSREQKYFSSSVELEMRPMFCTTVTAWPSEISESEGDVQLNWGEQPIEDYFDLHFFPAALVELRLCTTAIR